MLTVLASIRGCTIELSANTAHAAHVTAAALSKAYPGVPVGIWRGMRQVAGYVDGNLGRTISEGA